MIKFKINKYIPTCSYFGAKDVNKSLPLFISSVSLLGRPELGSALSTTFSKPGWCLSLILKEMSEQKKAPKSRVFYVGMKLLHKPGNKPLQEKNGFFHAYYKWVLWLSLSLYFFTSYLITSNPNNAPTSPDTSSHVVPRTLIDTTNSLGAVT